MTRSMSVRRTHFWRVALVVGLGITISCDEALAARLQGRVKNGVYSAPAKNFSVPVPQGLGTRVSDGYTKDEAGIIGAASFHDDFGTLLAIHYMSLDPDSAAKLQQGDASMLTSWLTLVAMPTWFLNASPQSRIVHQEEGTFENMRAAFAQVDIPGGSSMVRLDARGKSTRLDSSRGLVIFQRGKFIYMLATEVKAASLIFSAPAAQTPQDPPSAEAAADENWQRFVDPLKGFYKSIVFLD